MECIIECPALMRTNETQNNEMRERYQINIRYNQSNNKQMPMIPVKYPAAMNQGLDGTPLKLLEVQQ